MTSRVIDLCDIKKSYDNIQVLKNLSLYLDAGEIVCLVGPSGCGKTTIFRLIAELTQKDNGILKKVKNIRTGYVFQQPRLLPWKKVRDNLSIVQDKYLKEIEAKKLRQYLLKASDLIGHSEDYPGQLSGGMKQRLEFIRALSIKPDMLLLDEPFKSVDTGLRIKMRQLIIDYINDNNSILLITHDPVEAVLLADRIYLLSKKPTTVYKELKINLVRRKRTLKEDEIYNTLSKINQYYTDITNNTKKV